MSFMKRTIFALSIATVLLSSACVIAVQDPDFRGKFWPKGTFRKTLDLKPGGAISLENGEGNIEISGWKDDKIDISAEGSQEAPRSAGIYFIGTRSPPPARNIKGPGNSGKIRTRR